MTFETGIIHDVPTKMDDKSITRDIAFDYRARGFYCPTCYTGLDLTRTTCPYCGQSLRNPYEYIRGNKKYETNTAYIPGQDH